MAQIRLLGGQPRGGPKVTQPGLTVHRVDQDVVRIQVAVHHAALVQMRYRIGHIAGNAQGNIGCELETRRVHIARAALQTGRSSQGGVPGRDQRREQTLGLCYTAAGLGTDSKIGLYLYNSNEYLEAHYAAFKMRGVPINVNYRYLDDELWYLLDNSDSEAIIFHSSLGDRVARVADRLPKLKLLIEVDDGGAGQVPDAVAYDEVIAPVHATLDKYLKAFGPEWVQLRGEGASVQSDVFALGAILLVHLGARMNLFPLFGLTSPDFDQMNDWGKFKDLAHHTVLPLICYMIGSFAMLTMMTKNNLMDNLAADYVRTAVAKGAGFRRAVFGHAFRNSMIPIATSIGDLVTVFIGGSMLIETVFDIQGFGLLQYQAVLARDVPVIMGTLTVAAFLMMLGQVISDFIVAIVDPRIKFE